MTEFDKGFNSNRSKSLQLKKKSAHLGNCTYI